MRVAVLARRALVLRIRLCGRGRSKGAQQRRCEEHRDSLPDPIHAIPPFHGESTSGRKTLAQSTGLVGQRRGEFPCGKRPFQRQAAHAAVFSRGGSQRGFRAPPLKPRNPCVSRGFASSGGPIRLSLPPTDRREITPGRLTDAPAFTRAEQRWVPLFRSRRTDFTKRNLTRSAS